MATLATAQTELSWAGTGLRLTNNFSLLKHNIFLEEKSLFSDPWNFFGEQAGAQLKEA